MNVTIEDGDIDGGVIEDTPISEGHPTANFGGLNLALMHHQTTIDQSQLIKVSLADYGDVTWLNGKFTFKPISTGGSIPYNVKIWRVIPEWTESTATWSNRTTGTPWPGAAGAQGAGVDRANIEESTVSIDNVVTDFPITAATLNNYWKGDVDNKGVLIEQAQTGGSVHFGSSENAGNEPVFYGEYTEGGVPLCSRSRMINL